MGLPTPKLDDRTFQDLVREARAKIPQYCPEWTNHNLSDPGITLIELFCWLVDVLLYRLNRVPEKNYIKFMELIGVRLAPAHPASAQLTFYLTAPQSAASPIEPIPAGTEVATVRTETEDAIVFSTDSDLKVEVCDLAHFLITRDGVSFVDSPKEISAGEPLYLFNKEPPQVGNALYLGYREPLAGNVQRVTIGCVRAMGPGVDPTDPPLLWEYWDGAVRAWQPFERSPETDAWLERDGTGGFNRSGEVVLHVPRSAGSTEIDGKTAYWLRCRVIPARPDQRPYALSPAVTSVASGCIGGTVGASHVTRASEEVLGTGDGNPGQRFRLANRPIMALRIGETVEVADADGNYQDWVEVADFVESGREDRHFVCDLHDGEVLFGPAIRQPDGQMRQFGAIPPQGRTIRMKAYRWGGGTVGNVARNTLVVPKASIPYVASVTNRRAARGGTDPETVESAMFRTPLVVRAHSRAVTEADFEFFALESSPLVARAKCIQPRQADGDGGPPPGVVLVLIVPRVTEAEGQIGREQLKLPHGLKQAIRTYLDERRLLTSFVIVSEPEYVWAAVEARVMIKPGFDPNRVRFGIEKELCRFFNPVVGGPGGNGWPFGRDLIVSDVYSHIQGVRGVEYVEEALVYPVDASTGQRGKAVQRLMVPRTGLVCSYEHRISISEVIEP